MADRCYDIAIVGAGMAGASLAAFLAPDMSVLLLEAEDYPGYHATGRSAAFWTESYGGPDIQPLTTASGDWLWNPPARFGSESFLSPRGAITLARSDELWRISNLSKSHPNIEFSPMNRAALDATIPGLGAMWVAGLGESKCSDIDVGRMHQQMVRAAREAGAHLEVRTRVESAEIKDGRWVITSGDATFEAKQLANAAGAWADELAERAGLSKVGITPKRRTMVQARLDREVPPEMPLLLAADESFYCKPEGEGRLWLTPQDEHPVEAQDIAPEEEDVALAIARIEEAFDWRVEAVERKWAGLRSFAPDRLPVIGYDPSEPSFFWFAGQGGWGIQTAPAAAALARRIVTGQDDLILANINAELFSPARFQKGE